MFFLQFDDSQTQKANVSLSSAMTVIQDDFNSQGIPANLSPDDRASFMQTIDELHCSLSTNPPQDVDSLTLQSFLSTLKDMWIALGANPDDLGC